MRSQHSGDGIEPVKCEPKGRFSGDYLLDWGGETCEVCFLKGASAGSIQLMEDRYEIIQNGPLSRIWTLKKDGEKILQAKRRGIRSSIRIVRDNELFLLERKHLLSPMFLLSDNDRVIANYDKQKMFNRKLEIEVIDVEADFLLLAFAFWLVTSVRRASSGNLKA